jgi:Fe2+ transport system protein FeoA
LHNQSARTLPLLPEGGPAPAHRHSQPRARHPYLVFVRAGKDSWHQRLLRENPDRNWDCCVNWYVEPKYEAEADFYCTAPHTINKLQGFLEFRKQFGDHWPYRYVLLLDDDIYLRPGDLNHFFSICSYYQTYLSQPAQRWFTHTTLNSLVRNPACILRRVSFVEGMAPCFSAAALEELIHTFDWTKSIWGTDWAWGSLLQDREAVHVVDAVALYHTRTGNGRKTLYYQRLLAMGVEPGEELRSIQRRFPGFPGPRTFRTGHVYRPGIPKVATTGLMLLFERLKFIVRGRKQFMRNWRVLRARMADMLLK